MRDLSVTEAENTRQILVATARCLLEGGRPPVDVIDLAVDVDHGMLQCASSVHAQLGLLQDLFPGGGEHPRVIAGILDLAVSFGIASAESVGVSGALVGVVAEQDAARIGRLLAGAHRRRTDSDLFAGAAALLAAATSYLADAVGEHPLEVHDEIHRRAAAGRAHLGRYCRDHRCSARS